MNIPAPAANAIVAMKEFFVYMGSDGNLWAVSADKLQAGQLGGPAGQPPVIDAVEEAPADGNPYVRQDLAWIIMPKKPPNINLSDGINEITLTIGPAGDLWVSQTAGPNAGKTCDLTYGKWQ